MNTHDDPQLDAALEALARPEPPADHVARVLARSGPAALGGEGVGRPSPSRGDLRPRWVLPVAATLLVALGVASYGRLTRLALPDVSQVATGRSASGHDQSVRWGSPREIVQPVLPPEAYWGMDPFEEFRTLRPITARPGIRASRGAHPPRAAGGAAADDERAWPVEATADSSVSGLPALGSIELTSIVPPPLDIAPLAVNDAIALPEIAFDPIVMTPLAAEERP